MSGERSDINIAPFIAAAADYMHMHNEFNFLYCNIVACASSSFLLARSLVFNRFINKVWVWRSLNYNLRERKIINCYHTSVNAWKSIIDTLQIQREQVQRKHEMIRNWDYYANFSRRSLMNNQWMSLLNCVVISSLQLFPHDEAH